jgi:hypothetical protein
MPSLQRCIIRSRRVLVYILRALLMLNATRLSCARNDAQPSFQGGAHTHEFRSFSVCGDSGIRAKSLNTAGPWTIDFGGCSFSGNTHGAPLVRAGSCPDRAGCLDLSYNSITLVPSNAFQGMGNMTWVPWFLYVSLYLHFSLWFSNEQKILKPSTPLLLYVCLAVSVGAYWILLFMFIDCHFLGVMFLDQSLEENI